MEIEQHLKKISQKKKESLLSIRLCRQTTAHFVPRQLMYYLNINDVILHCFIISSYPLMLVVWRRSVYVRACVCVCVCGLMTWFVGD